MTESPVDRIVPKNSTPLPVIAEDVVMGVGCRIGRGVVIESNVTLGREVEIGDGVFIGEGCRIGDGCRIEPKVVLREHTWIGKDVVIESGVILGSDGFGFAQRADGTQFKIPQVGIVEIGDFSRIGARSTVDRATLGKTIVGDNVQIGSLVMVGHNVAIGAGCRLDNQCGVSGSTKIGEGTVIGTHAGLVGHLKVGGKSRIESCTGVTKTLPEGTHLKGLFPAMDPVQFGEQQELIARLPEVVERLDRIEEKAAAAV